MISHLYEVVSTEMSVHYLLFYRFGKIASIVTLFELEAGTELLACYNYSVNDCPDWYLQQPVYRDAS